MATGTNGSGTASNGSGGASGTGTQEVTVRIHRLGGGVSQAFDLLSAGIHQVIAREAMPAFRDVRVVPAELGGDVGLIGATAVALLQMEEGGR